MEQINKIDIAKDIVERLIVQECKKSYDSDDAVLKMLIEMKDEVLKNNNEVIDEVLKNYSDSIRGVMYE